MKKWYDGLKAEEMLRNVTRDWTETGEYTDGQRGPCGELGWKRRYVEIDGTVYDLTYDRDGWPTLHER